MECFKIQIKNQLTIYMLYYQTVNFEHFEAVVAQWISLENVSLRVRDQILSDEEQISKIVIKKQLQKQVHNLVA